MLTRTLKRVKEVVDKMRLPDVVRLRRCFWDSDKARHHTATDKLKFVMRQLKVPRCEMKGQDAERGLQECCRSAPSAGSL